MKSTDEKQIVLLEQIDPKKLPELKGWKENQEQIVKDNPFVIIKDNKTYEEAKKSRTSLVKARTSIEKQDKLIASKIQDFRKKAIGLKDELIAITQPHEVKQQNEVKRWEKIKEEEKVEKARLEQERIDKIKNEIQSIFDSWNEKIKVLTFNEIKDFLMEDILEDADTSKFEEFEIDFIEKKETLKTLLDEKVKQLQEKESQRIEAEKLKKEREILEAEKKKAEEEARKKREKLDAERKKIEEERKRLEEEKKAKEEADKKVEQERLDAERKTKEEEENKKRLEAERKRSEALKPDKEKISKFIDSLEFTLQNPKIKDADLNDWLKQTIHAVEITKHNLKNELSNLK